MKYTILDSYSLVAKHVAQDIAETVRRKPDALLCLAAGHTSLGVFDEMIRMQEAGETNFRTAYIVGLDEWSGMSREDDGSCAGFLYKNIFDRLGIHEEHIKLFDGKYSDAEEECSSVEQYIADHGGIDHMFLGIGMNGHLGLNEPGTDFLLGAHETEISETTNLVGQKYFSGHTELTKGITLGIRNILESRRIVLVADSSRKSGIIKEFYYSESDASIPATALKNAKNCEIVLDADAAVNIRQHINDPQKAVIGIDIGGTKTLMIIRSLSGRIIYENAFVSSGNCTLLRSHIEEGILASGLNHSGIKALALGVPGRIDPDRMVATDAPGLGWKGLSLQNELFRFFRFPCVIENDGTMALIAETSSENQNNIKLTNCLTIVIGTGLGSAYMADGRIISGAHHSAGEIGYCIFEESNNEIRNSAGFFGFLESKISGSALEKSAKGITPQELFSSYDDNPAKYKEIVDVFIHRLAITIANLVSILDPGEVIIGGGVSRSLEPFLERIKIKVRQYTPISANIRISAYFNRAGAIGACIRAESIQHLQETIGEGETR
jgi:glucosamine-6-phosphate isomerase